MRTAPAHARIVAGIGLLALAMTAPAAMAAEPPLAVTRSIDPTGSDLAARRWQRILYQDRWNRARSLYEIGDYQSAAAYYMALVNQPIGEKALYEVRYRLAECLYQVGAYPAAAHYFEMVRAAGPARRHWATASARLAELSVKAGNIPAARAYLAAADAADVRSQAAYVLGRALAATSPAEAVVYLESVATGSRYYPEARYHLGALAATSPASYALAVSYFTQARLALPKQVRPGPGTDRAEPERIARLHELIALALARLHADRGVYDRALAEYARVPAQGRYRDAALLESAWVLLRKNQVLPALENVRRLLEEKPESPLVLEAALLVGYLTIEQQRFNEAYGHFEDIRVLLESLAAQLAAYAVSVSDPAAFYAGIVEHAQATTLPVQIGLWVDRGPEIVKSSRLLDEVREVEEQMRDIHRQLDEIELLAAGPRGATLDPAGVENLVRLNLSDSLYELQGRVLELRLRPFLKYMTTRERELLRLIRRVRTDLLLIRRTPADMAQASARGQIVLGQLNQYLLRLHPEIGLDTAKKVDHERVASVDDPLAADAYLRTARRELAELSREASLDDRWIDAALEYTVYLEDRLQWVALRRLRVDERFDFVRRSSVLFRQSAELQAALRELGGTLADIQEFILLDARARTASERKVLARYQQTAHEIRLAGAQLRGRFAQREYARITTTIADTAVRADLGALDTGWRVKELEDQKVRELLSEKRERLERLQAYYARVASAAAEAPFEGFEGFSPERLAQGSGRTDSPYGRELIALGREVLALAQALSTAQLQIERLQAGAEAAVLSPEEIGAERDRRGETGGGLRIEMTPGKRTLPLETRPR